MQVKARNKAEGLRVATQTRAKLGEVGHLHTSVLHPASSKASLADFKQIFTEKRKGFNKM